MAKSSGAEKCLTKACARGAAVRGLCTACIQNYRNAVKRGDITEKRAIEIGAVKERHFAGRKPLQTAWAISFGVEPKG